MTTAWLHIGMDKTGTSSIQRFLREHPRVLRADGYLYPATGREGSAHYLLSRALGFFNAGPAAALDRVQRSERPARVTTRLDRHGAAALRTELRAEVQRSGCRAFVLSSEDFVLPGDPRAVAELLDGFDARIVVYLRRHDHWFRSAYSEAATMARTPRWEFGPDGYARYRGAQRTGRGEYRALLQRWEQVFGRAALVVRPFEAEQNPDGVVADFLRTIGASDAAVAAASTAQRRNESLPAHVSCLLDALHRAHIDPLRRRALEQRVVARCTRGGPEPGIDPRLRAELVAPNRVDYDFIARTYLRRDDGRLFLEADPSADDPPELACDRVELCAALIDAIDATRASPLRRGLRALLGVLPSESAGDDRPGCGSEADRVSTWQALFPAVPMAAGARAELMARQSLPSGPLPGIPEIVQCLLDTLDAGVPPPHDRPASWRACLQRALVRPSWSHRAAAAPAARPVSRLLVLSPGTLPSTDFYFGARAAAGADVVVLDMLANPAAPTALPDGCNVLVVRHAPRAWLRLLSRERARLGQVVYFIDDDMGLALGDSSLPLRYATRTTLRFLRTQRALAGVANALWVSTPELACRYPAADGRVCEPLYVDVAEGMDHGPITEPSYFYHGTWAHRRELEWLVPVVREVQRRMPEARFEVTGDARVRRLYHGIAGVTVRATMPWPQYRALGSHLRLRLGLAPCLDSPFNRARSHVKLFDITRLGAAGVYSDLPPYSKVIEHGRTGWLCANDPEHWVERIVEGLGDADRCAAIRARALAWSTQRALVAGGWP